MKNLKQLCIILAITISFMNFNSFAYAENHENLNCEAVSNLTIKENTNGSMEFSYDKIENGKIIKYEEILDNNHVETKKYEGDTLIDSFESFIDINDSGEISVRIEKKDLIEVVTIEQTIQNDTNQPGTYAIAPSNKVRHPLDKEYYRVLKTGGHLGFKKMTQAAIVGVIGAAVGGGNLVIGSLASIATLIINGGYRNVWYTEELYYPYGGGMKGKPLSKTVVKMYSGNDRSRQLGSTLYYESDLTVKVN